jgi:hypothetical protein
MSSIKRLVPLHAVELSADPPNGRIGDIYFNSALKELRFFDGSQWQTSSGAIRGLLDHVHTYDGLIYSVENVEVPNPGYIDGGNA